jgi:hypothetical protein
MRAGLIQLDPPFPNVWAMALNDGVLVSPILHMEQWSCLSPSSETNCVLFTSAGTEFSPMSRAWCTGLYCVGELYCDRKGLFSRQAATLLKFAKSTFDAKLAALLLDKAAELKSQESSAPDVSPLAPDIEFPERIPLAPDGDASAGPEPQA